MLKSSDKCGDDNIHLILNFGNSLYTIGNFKRSQTEERFSNDYNFNIFHITSSIVSIKEYLFIYLFSKLKENIFNINIFYNSKIKNIFMSILESPSFKICGDQYPK